MGPDTVSARRALGAVLPEPISRPSPNFGPRRGVSGPDMVILHYTAMDSADAALERLCDPVFEVSAHFLIATDGMLIQMVREEDRAWHAGRSSWGGVSDVNSRSVGIELENRGDHPFAAPQMDALSSLLSNLRSRFGIPRERVLGHSDVAPDRKIDPGPRFDWQRLAREGHAVWPSPAGPAKLDVGRFADDVQVFGYEVATPSDEGLKDVLRAVRLRFRPGADGPLAAEDCAIMADLAARFPVDRGRGSA